MAQFFIPTAAVESTGRHYHPAIRNDVALDMSLKKLGEMKSAQRVTHRPANLLKTVLVYNMFKAAIAPVTQTVSVVDMEVDNKASEEAEVAAEQSWFDRCIDNMLTEDSQEAMEVTSTFCVGEDDDDEDVEEVGGGLLKRSPSLQSLSMLAGDSQCLAIATAAQPPVMVVAAAEDMTPGAWQKDGLWPTRDPQTIHANIFTL
ncbi:hypothetical protein IWW37_004251 [Coemansia sp. RSA 2050]|nr:hypothetical protein IWW37_004251 [Coemansia sp. RSA 2050]KAJ2731574.1 hypothetical protein IW152_004442 [Coemansia sp. BCRC 34962]